MHRYRYLTKYCTLEEVRAGINETAKVYEKYKDIIGTTPAIRKKRMKSHALIELRDIVAKCKDMEDFVYLVNQRIGDADETDIHIVEHYIYKWVMMNVAYV